MRKGAKLKGLTIKMLHAQLGVRCAALRQLSGVSTDTKIQGKDGHHENPLQASASKLVGHRFQS